MCPRYLKELGRARIHNAMVYYFPTHYFVWYYGVIIGGHKLIFCISETVLAVVEEWVIASVDAFITITSKL